MKKTIYCLLFILGVSTQGISQEKLLNPQNNPASINLLKTETSKMEWFMVRDSIEIKIGEIHTEIKKEKNTTAIITSVVMKQSPYRWIDTTLVRTQNLAPIYHSSYNQQRNLVLHFGEKITGYYLDKKTSTKTQICQEVNEFYFDSNFYPQLLRLLPLKKGYSNRISIFDYNPKSKVGLLTATLKSTKDGRILFNGKQTAVWQLEVTDDISNNRAIMTYSIDKLTRKILRQELHLGDRKMIMKLLE